MQRLSHLCRWQRTRPLVVPLVALSGVLVAWHLHWQGTDFPAQIYRVDLFSTHGWVLWNNDWYAGHYVLPYSLLFPAVGATVGLYGAAAASATAAAWAFERLVRGAFAEGSIVAGVLFGIGMLGPVATGQLPFLSGEAAGLLALLAARQRRAFLALVLAVSCPLLSPVAGAFLVLALFAWAIVSPHARRRALLGLTAVTALPLIVLGLAFPESGPYPFWGTDLAVIVTICAVGMFVIPTRQQVLRMGLILYAAIAIVVFFVPNPLGGNFGRLAQGIAPGAVIAVGWTSRRRTSVILALPLLWWQWSPAFAAMHSSSNDASANVAYFKPLLGFLARQPMTGRVEIPFTRHHWEAAYVAPSFPLARGWERQTDAAVNRLFYDDEAPTAAKYRTWLDNTGVTWVALPDVPLDYSSRGEARLLERPPSYLRPVWHNAHWRVWRVDGSPGIVSGPGHLVSLQPDRLSVFATAKGTMTIRVRYTPYWDVVGGRACVSSTPDGWTRLVASGPGRIDIAASLFDDDSRCATTPGEFQPSALLISPPEGMSR